jgi:transcriptional regulator with XRE-family HTH domain
MQEKKLTLVHKRLRSLAESRGLKNADLARIAEVSAVAVGKWFSAGQIPKAEQLLKIARFFDVSIEWILLGEAKESESIEARIESTISGLKEMDHVMAPAVEARARTFWRNIHESHDEFVAASGGPDKRPDILIVTDLLESASRDFKDAVDAFAAALREAGFASESDASMILRKWNDLATAANIFCRRQDLLTSEIRAKNQIEEW